MCARRFLFDHLRTDADGGRRGVRDVSVRRQRPVQTGDSAGPFPGDGGGRRTRLYRSVGVAGAPGQTGDPALWVPDGVEGPLNPAPPRYSTFTQPPIWSATAGTRRSTPAAKPRCAPELFVRSQVSAFNAAGKIWAPRYRQAAFGAFLLDSKDARAALDLAYSDVAAAFDRSSPKPATARSSSPATARGRST